MSPQETSTRGKRNLLDADLQKHRDCMDVLSDLETCLERPADAEGRWLVQLQTCFTKFSETLRSHFVREERGRLYQELPIRFPRLAGRAKRLHSEHGRILEDLDRVVDRVNKLRQGGDENAEELRADALSLVAGLQRHEVKEIELLQTAYWREVGAGD